MNMMGEDPSRYTMMIFGVDTQEQSIAVKVTGFRPRFYVNIPKAWPDPKISAFISTVKNKDEKTIRFFSSKS